MLENYNKKELALIVDYFNMKLTESELSKKKADIIKRMREVGKKGFEKKLGKVPDTTHKMPDGTVMSGKKHSKLSKPIEGQKKITDYAKPKKTEPKAKPAKKRKLKIVKKEKDNVE